MTTNFNIQLLGEILAQKYMRLIEGERDNIHIAPRIQSTRFPNGFVIYWKDKIKINTFDTMKRIPFLILILGLITFQSCKKCHTCQITTSVYRWQSYQAGPGQVQCCGEVVPPVTVEDEFCGLTKDEIATKEKGNVVTSSAPITPTRTQWSKTTTLCNCN
jgi:hypothetical protein